MAKAKGLDGSALLIKVGDGADPEVFSHPCLINTSRGIEFPTETNQQQLPDCDNPLLMAWQGTRKTAIGCQVSGSGVLHTPNVETFFNWVSSPNTKNVRVELSGVSGANGGGYWAGAFHLTQFSVTGSRGEYCECSITLVADGEVTWTDAS